MKVLKTLQEKFQTIQLILFDEENKKKKLIILISVLIFLLLVLILILCLNNKKENKVISNKYEISDYFYSPISPEIADEYMYSRVQQQKWTEEEVEKYITLPSEQMLDSLKSANDNIVNDILEAAP
jgi:cell division protein FtsX